MRMQVIALKEQRVCVTVKFTSYFTTALPYKASEYDTDYKLPVCHQLSEVESGSRPHLLPYLYSVVSVFHRNLQEAEIRRVLCLTSEQLHSRNLRRAGNRWAGASARRVALAVAVGRKPGSLAG
ncbi:hypothetical protein EVAR_20007_1 [Eumeta japonica]|uniref:Uncharacterized protein n=1 Tax=Eumeta variegata TaxID=151549 RepID=A0A4C1VB40_EUMVA|nr:hypothetical protein EVAR_20007_1 [Eumeta japonica]